MKDELIALAIRCEAATGPDRELDGLIHIALFVDKERAGRIDHYSGVVGWWPKEGCYVSAVESLRFTASLDAAMTLVPEGHDWSLHADNGEAIAGCKPADPEGCDCANCHAAAPALALTAAALRARAAMEAGE